MARMDFKGLDSVIDSMGRMGERTGTVARNMLKAGAEEMAEARREEAEHRGLHRTGLMIKNIKMDKIKESGGALSTTVYSKGTGKDGVRNAEKEYLDHYGYKRRPASHWIDAAEKKGEAPAQRAMTAIWDEHIKQG